MRRFILMLAGAAALAALAAAPASAGVSPSGRYIVVFDGASAPGQLTDQLSQQLGFEPTHVYRNALSGFAAKLPAAAAAALEANPNVAYVQPDFTVSIAAQTLPTGINRIDAELSPTAQIDGVDRG